MTAVIVKITSSPKIDAQIPNVTEAIVLPAEIKTPKVPNAIPRSVFGISMRSVLLIAVIPIPHEILDSIRRTIKANKLEVNGIAKREAPSVTNERIDGRYGHYRSEISPN